MGVEEFAGFFIFTNILMFFLPIIAYFFILIVVINAIRKSHLRKNITNYFKENIVEVKEQENKKKNKYVDLTKKELSEYHIDDIEPLKNHLFKIFEDFETAYNNLDYNIMKLNSTNEIYHNYYTSISLDLEIGKKRIIEDIKRKNVIIYEMYSSNQKQVISTMIEISYKTYTIDKNGYVVSGDRNNSTKEKFEVVFRKDFGKTEVTKCPNCGATIVGNKCEYCRTPITTENYRISSIKRIVE